MHLAMVQETSTLRGRMATGDVHGEAAAYVTCESRGKQQRAVTICAVKLRANDGAQLTPTSHALECTQK
jgi:hypothetical protein